MQKEELYKIVDESGDILKKIEHEIWNYAEVANTEYKSAAILKEYLEKQGFEIKEVPEMPTAFVAEYGQGHPIIGILGEYDALPGLSQKVSTQKEPVEEGGNGHGCGHNLIGTGCAGAVSAVKAWMEKEKIQGTIRCYGCPAEEQLTGKGKMATKGVFSDLDIALSWHPWNSTEVLQYSSLAVISLKFKFKGIPAHAAMAPQAGRSALDAVELMNVGCNYLREHIIDTARIHYVITNGGRVPNVVPEDAEVWYNVRAPKMEQVKEILQRVYAVAEGAALMTGTKVTHEVISGCYDMIINRKLSEILNNNLHQIGAPKYKDEDWEFAEEFQNRVSDKDTLETMASFFVTDPEIVCGKAMLSDILEMNNWDKVMPGSFDHGDVSYIAPFAYLAVASFFPGCGGHTWQSTACAGSGLGEDALMCATKVLVGSIYDILQNPEILKSAKEEFQKKTGGKPYVSSYEL